MTVFTEKSGNRTARTVLTRSTVLSAALITTLGLAACGGKDDNTSAATSTTGSAAVTAPESGDAGASITAADGTGDGEGAAATGLRGFIVTAASHGYACVESPDPFIKKDGLTCSPSGADALNRAIFSLFDKSVIASGSDAAKLAGGSMGGGAGASVEDGNLSADDGEGNSVDLGNITAGPEQFRPVDSKSFAGYCVDSLGNCADSGLDEMGLTLG